MDQDEIDDDISEAGGNPHDQKDFQDMVSATSGPPQVDDGAGAGGDAAAGDTSGQQDQGAAAGGDQGAGGDRQQQQPAQQQRPAAKDGQQPAITAEDDDDDDGVSGQDQNGQERKKPRRVSATRYRELEARYTTSEAERLKLAETQARLDERLRLLNEALTAPNPQQQAQEEVDDDPEPDANIDVFANLEWQKRQRVRDREAFNARIDALENGTRAQNAEQQMQSNYERDARNFAAQTPDFKDAYLHLMASRLHELAMVEFGIDIADSRPEAPKLNDSQIASLQNVLAREEKGIVALAVKNKRSPAEQLYNLAKVRGYRKAEPQQAAGGQQAAGKPAANGGNGQQRQNGNGNGGQQPNVAEEIAALKNGQDAALSLSSGGGAPRQPLTIEKLVGMDDEQFSAYLDNMSPEQLKLMVEGRPD